MDAETRYVAYYRLSRPKRRKARDGTVTVDWGLSRDAQEAAVTAYVAANPGRIVASYEEIETGTKASDRNRPEMQRALAHCRSAQATLLIAKLDRLARNVHYVSGLMESKVKFVALDIPNADAFMLHIYAAMAEQEAKRIGERTKAGLAARRAQGRPLGGEMEVCRNLSPEARQRGNQAAGEAVSRLATDYYRPLASRVRELRESGLSVRDISDRFNAEGLVTRLGSPWNPVQVLRVERRFRRQPVI